MQHIFSHNIKYISILSKKKTKIYCEYTYRTDIHTYIERYTVSCQFCITINCCYWLSFAWYINVTIKFDYEMDILFRLLC